LIQRICSRVAVAIDVVAESMDNIFWRQPATHLTRRL